MWNKFSQSKFKVVVDGVNSTGGIAIPKLLKELGVEVIELYCTPDGHFMLIILNPIEGIITRY